MPRNQARGSKPGQESRPAPDRRGRAFQYRRLRRGLSRRSGRDHRRQVGEWSPRGGTSPRRPPRGLPDRLWGSQAKPLRGRLRRAWPPQSRPGRSEIGRHEEIPPHPRHRARASPQPQPRAYADPCAASYRSSTCLTLLLAHCPFPDGVGTCSAFNAVAIAASDRPSPRSCAARAAEGGNGAGGRPNRTPRSRAAAIPADTSGRRISDSLLLMSSAYGKKVQKKPLGTAFSIPFPVR